MQSNRLKSRDSNISISLAVQNYTHFQIDLFIHCELTSQNTYFSSLITLYINVL
jgi:hypothetical protein